VLDEQVGGRDQTAPGNSALPGIRSSTLSASALFEMIGTVPHTQWLEDSLTRDDHGFILTGRDLVTAGQAHCWLAEHPPLLLETGMPGVFARVFEALLAAVRCGLMLAQPQGAGARVTSGSAE
jgi:hypothetical protein